MTGLVVITRPRDEAEALAATLGVQGYPTLVEPLLRIVDLATPIPDLKSYDALAFTSANGVSAFAAKSVERAVPVFAVGERTAAVLREAGFTDIRVASGDAAALAGLIAGNTPAVSRLLYVTGTVVARDLKPLLAGSVQTVDRVALYDAVMADRLSPDLVSALYACTVGHVLFFSPRTAAAFGTLARKHGLTKMIRSCSALCLSAQVASQAAGLPWGDVQVAATPTADRLLLLLPPVDHG